MSMRALAVVSRSVLLIAALAATGAAGGFGLSWADDSASVLVSFDESQFPEGLAVAPDGTIYVGIANTGDILEVDPSGNTVTLASVVLPEGGVLLGLEEHAGSVYALVSAGPASGVHVISRSTGSVSQVATLPADSFPNDLVFGDRGQIYVSDTAGGRILEVQPFGEVRTWFASPLIQGNVADPGPLGIPIGANGIAWAPDRKSLYVAVTEGARVVEIPVDSDGSAGEAVVVAEAPSLGGADGIVFGPDGTLYVTSFVQNHVVAIDIDTGNVEVVLSGDSYHAPATAVFSPDFETLYITNFDGLVLFGLAPGPPITALLAVDAASLAKTVSPGITPPSTGSAGLAATTFSSKELLSE
jgi:sugar lactone lactonase YvrE